MPNKGLYVHIPFCKSKCAYCDFYSQCADYSIITEYISAIEKEIIKWGAYSYVFDTVYIGGGTPSLLGDKIGHLLNIIKSNLNITNTAEITVEANPESCTDLFIDSALKNGVNRFSLGLQSSDDAQLKTLHRLHTKQDFENCYNAIINKNINNISIDIMLGLPGEDSFKKLKSTINYILNLNPTHISAYILKVEENTVMYKMRDKYTFLDDEETAEQYLYLCDILQKSGYEHYEISNFAKKGYKSRHNLKYWQGVDYLGIGPAAHSLINERRFYCKASLRDFLTNPTYINDGTADPKSENIILGLRLNTGYDFSNYPHIIPFLNKLCKNGYGSFTGTKFALSNKGFLVSNNIICEILEKI